MTFPYAEPAEITAETVKDVSCAVNLALAAGRFPTVYDEKRSMKPSGIRKKLYDLNALKFQGAHDLFQIGTDIDNT